MNIEKAVALVDPGRDQELRGLIVSVILSMIGGATDLTLRQLKYTPDNVFVFHDIILYGTLGFLGDIAFAEKEGYCLWTKKCKTGNKDSWWGHVISTLGSTRALKMAISTITDMMVLLPIFLAFKQRYPDVDPVIDKMVKMGLWLGLFLTYNNKLRFEWAYAKDVSPSMDLLVGIFATLVSLVFFLTPIPEAGEPGHELLHSKFRWVSFWLLFIFIAVYNGLRSDTGVGIVKAARSLGLRSTMVGATVLYVIFSVFTWGITRPEARDPEQIAETRAEFSLAMAAVGVVLAVTFLGGTYRSGVGR